MFKQIIYFGFVSTLVACSSMHSSDSSNVKYKDNQVVSENEFNHDLLTCNTRYKSHLSSPLVLEPKSKEEFFRSCLGSLGYQEKGASTEDKRQFVFNFKEIEFNLIKLNK
ncbi:MAG: hypothetical protein LLG15_02015 [Betaproteobacteria bacterium]|nr:hypothetical protein [Betaproteobacteria bacterium]